MSPSTIARAHAHPMPHPSHAVLRVGVPPQMGRAEKRMAKKRAKKGAQYEGGRPTAMPSGGTDTVPKDELLRRLSEVPVFGLQSGGAPGGSFIESSDGERRLFFDVKEAEMERVRSSNPDVRVVGIPLSECFFESGHVWKPAASAIAELGTVPEGRRLSPKISVPLFCIDGLQTTDKNTGIESVPLFNSKMELMEFAIPVYGKEVAESKVLATDLEVVVTNMLRGPAGRLRRARFFSDASGLTWMDKQAKKNRKS